MADFQAHLDDLNDRDCGVVALSVDSLEDAQTVKDEENLEFPVVYGLSVPDDADTVGAYWEEDRGIFHATNFLLRDGNVFHSTYSSGPLGRLRAENVAGLIDFYENQ